MSRVRGVESSGIDKSKNIQERKEAMGFHQRDLCVLLCFIKPMLRNCYVRSWGFIVSEPRETHP